MSEQWWDELPDGSSVRLEGHMLSDIRTVDCWEGTWFWGREVVFDDAFTGAKSATVIYVPVTDAEPPVGSIVETPEALVIRHDDGWRPYGEHWAPLSWQSVKPNVTRILRWGE